MNYEEFKKSITEEERHIVNHYEQVVKSEHVQKVLEVGSGWGLFSRVCLEAGKELVTIDKQNGYGMEAFNKNTEGFEGKFERIQYDSQKLLPTKQDEWKDYFDVILVDADHGYDGALADLKNSWNLLRPGGVLLVDDVFHKENWEIEQREKKGFNFGVTKALWTFIKDRREEMPWDGVLLRIVGHGLISIKKNV